MVAVTTAVNLPGLAIKPKESILIDDLALAGLVVIVFRLKRFMTITTLIVLLMRISRIAYSS